VMGPTGARSYQMIGGSLIPISDNSGSYITEGYGINDSIFSIINLVLDKVRQAPWSVYEVVDESSLKSYHALQSKHDSSAEDMRKARDLQHKGLKPVKNPGKWKDLLENPNEDDSFQELVANGAGYKMLTGNKFLWANLLDKGANSGFPQELWVMPSQWMQVVAGRGFPTRVLGYNMPVLGLTGIQGYTKEEVMHEKYFNYDYNASGSHLIGMAPLKAGLKLTNRDNSALDVSTSKFQNGGLEGVLYMDEPNISANDRSKGNEQMTALKQKLIREYSGTDNWGKLATSGYKIGFENLGLSPVELDIIAAEKWNMRRFCNLFGGVPSQLLNDPENKTYNNQKEGEKALMSRCGLAHLTSFRNSFNRKARRYWKLDGRWIIDFDMSVYGELQADASEMMKWLGPLAKLTGMSPNRILDLMGLEKMNDKIFDEPWIDESAMGIPFSEWKMNEVDRSLNDGDE
jgi:HK97 family phage portal protein